MTISEVSKKYNISSDTLRYYEKVGVIPHVTRKPNNIRNYAEKDIEWLELALCMRNAGLPIEVMIKYLELYQKGDETLKERCELLIKQRDALQEQKRKIEDTLNHLNYKISKYEKALKTGKLVWD